MHRFDPAPLEDYMLSHVEGFQGPLTVRQFRGGQSNPTYLLESPSGKYVMRRKPPGKLLKSAHAVDREFRVISALYAADFPVPRPSVLQDEEVVGTIFFIMEFVEGRIFWDRHLPGVAPDERTAIYDNTNQTIANLHNFDAGKIGLVNTAIRQLFCPPGFRWTKQYIASETGKIEEMEKLIAWLPDNIPDDESSAVVHGDFRLDNMIMHPDGAPGDRRARLGAVDNWPSARGFHLPPDVLANAGDRYWQYWSGRKGSAALGIPSADEYVEILREPGGRAVLRIAISIRHTIFSAWLPYCRESLAGSGMALQQMFMLTVPRRL